MKTWKKKVKKNERKKEEKKSSLLSFHYHDDGGEEIASRVEEVRAYVQRQCSAVCGIRDRVRLKHTINCLIVWFNLRFSRLQTYLEPVAMPW